MVVSFALVMLFASDAMACPDCVTARVVRASVFDGSFWTNLCLISLPLVVLGVITALLYRIGIEPRPQMDTAPAEEART